MPALKAEAAATPITPDQLTTGGVSPKSTPVGSAGGRPVVNLGIDTSSVLKPSGKKANAELFAKLPDLYKAEQSRAKLRKDYVPAPLLSQKIQRVIAIALIVVGAALFLIGLAASSAACSLIGALIGIGGAVGYHFTASQVLPRAQKLHTQGKVVISAETKTSLDKFNEQHRKTIASMPQLEKGVFKRGPKKTEAEIMKWTDPRIDFEEGHPNVFVDYNAKKPAASLNTGKDKASVKLEPMGLNKFADVKPAKKN
jgi:hypothetical protein